MVKDKAETQVTKEDKIGFEFLPTNRLVPSQDNKRQPVTKRSLRSLARSVKHIGIIEPIIVRPHPSRPNCWEIRAGERRWRAARLAGLRTVPVIVRDLDEPTAISITLVENSERQDLHPLEEAEAIQVAFDRKVDIRVIAANLGRSVQYVTRRASLTRLIPAWRQEILRSGSDAGRLSAAHLELIARLPDTTQTLLADEDFQAVFSHGIPTVEELTRIIDRGLHCLKAMPWKLDDDTLDPTAGSCLDCPKRSGMQPLLFDSADVSRNGKVSPTDRCLDPACFDRKLAAYLAGRESLLRQEHPNLILLQTAPHPLSPTLAELFGERIRREYCPRFVKAGEDGAIPVMPVDGPKAGKLLHLEAEVGRSPSGRPGTDANGKKHGPLSLAERQARLDKRRGAYIVKQVVERLRSFGDPGQPVKVEPPPRSAKVDALALLLAFGTDRRADHVHGEGGWEQYDKLGQLSVKERTALALQNVAQVWIRRLNLNDSAAIPLQTADASRMSAILGLDYSALVTEAEASFPEPESWKHLSAESPETLGET